MGPVGDAPEITEEEFLAALFLSIDLIPSTFDEIKNLQDTYGGTFAPVGSPGITPQVIQYDGQKVGWITTYERDGELNISQFEIFDTFQGKGIGRMVIENLQKEYDYIYSHNIENNEFWEKMGFEEIYGDARWHR